MHAGIWQGENHPTRIGKFTLPIYYEDHPALVSRQPGDLCDLASSYFLPQLYQMAQRNGAVRMHGEGMPLIKHILQIWQGYCKNSAVQR
jgi:hypothetical protein